MYNFILGSLVTGSLWFCCSKARESDTEITLRVLEQTERVLVATSAVPPELISEFTSVKELVGTITQTH